MLSVMSTPPPTFVPHYGWSNEATLISYHHWLPYESFLNMICKFRFMSFSTKANRDIMKITLENLANSVPFSQNTRFPSGKIYIDLHHSVVSAHLRQLSLALDISDRQLEKERTDLGKGGISKHYQSSSEDAKVAFYSAMHNIVDLVGNLDIEHAHVVGVYITSSFESEYRLVWNNEAPV